MTRMFSIGDNLTNEATEGQFYTSLVLTGIFTQWSWYDDDEGFKDKNLMILLNYYEALTA